MSEATNLQLPFGSGRNTLLPPLPAPRHTLTLHHVEQTLRRVVPHPLRVVLTGVHHAGENEIAALQYRGHLVGRALEANGAGRQRHRAALAGVLVGGAAKVVAEEQQNGVDAFEFVVVVC